MSNVYAKGGLLGPVAKTVCLECFQTLSRFPCYAIFQTLFKMDYIHLFIHVNPQRQNKNKFEMFC